MSSPAHPEDKLRIYPGNETLPNASAVLTLGILSLILFCCCGGVVGMVLSIIALVLGNKSLQLYEINPYNYSMVSYNNVKNGKTCAIIGLIINGLMILFSIIRFIFYGNFFLQNDIWEKFT
jgi:hypothetical protein